MIAQILLSLIFTGVCFYSVSKKSQLALTSNILVVISLCAIYFTWNPHYATLIANKLGIGRGADLIFYFGGIILFVIIINIRIQLRIHHGELTELARKIAITNARCTRE